MNACRLLQRCGLFVRAAARSVWAHGQTAAQFFVARPLLEAIMRERLHTRLVVTSAAPSTLEYLQRAFPDEQATPPPWDLTFAVQRFLAALRPGVLLLLDGGHSFGPVALRQTLRAGVPIAVFAARPEQISPHLIEAAAAARGRVVFCLTSDLAQDVALLALDEALVTLARNPGRPDEHPAAVSQVLRGSSAVAKAAASDATARCLAALEGILPSSPDLPPVHQAWRVPTLRDTIWNSALWQRLAPLFVKRRYDDLDGLRKRLGNPRAILCMGNGPSSEHSGLVDVEYDCLMRVNWRWKERGLLTHPDLVFVGDPVTVHKLSGCMFGFWNREIEYGMLLRMASRGLWGRECVTVERVCPLIGEREWPARPTNGALMIALAAALQPQRLIIGGMDLFAHPEGRYPGDVLASNQYSRVHTRDTDVAIIRLALQQYRGQVVVLSDNLSESLA